jgi:hypothetical protein
MKARSTISKLITIGAVGIILELAGLFYLFASAPTSTSEMPVPTKTSAQAAYGKLPLSFEANQGQTDGRVKFLARGNGYTLYLTNDEALLQLRNNEPGARNPQSTALRMKLVGANPTPQTAGLGELAGKSNYFIGSNPKNWRTNVPMYSKAKFSEVYPGVDVVYYGAEQRQLEYDFIVAPGADPKAIRFNFDGADKIDLNKKGDLTMRLNDKELQMRKPIVYQEKDGAKQEVKASYKLTADNEVGFEIAAYDQARPLVIDPVLIYSTFLGGTGQDAGLEIAVNAHGNAFVTGLTTSLDFPPEPAAPKLGPGGGFDAFVIKLNAEGNQLLYSTYLGGSNDENTHGGVLYGGLAIDAHNNAYVTGLTKSANFPVFPNPGAFQIQHNGGVADGFVAKLNAAGNALIYSTYFGGIGFDGNHGIAVDSSGQAYVTGYDGSGSLPANGFQATHSAGCASGNADGFVAKLNPFGTGLLYYSYFGGNSCNQGWGITVDAAQNAFVTGETQSTNFPTLGAFDTTCGTDGACNGGQADIFVTRVDTKIFGGSSLKYSTYLGGSKEERFTYNGNSIAVDKDEFIYVTGLTASVNPADFPTKNAAQPTPNCYPKLCATEAFITKLKGDQLAYSTYLGGPGDEFGSGIAVDVNGNAYVAGASGGTFPSTSGLPTCADPGAFVAKLNAAGEIKYATCISGTGQDTGLDIAIDPAGCAYVTGWTESYNFPVVNPLQPLFKGGGAPPSDAFIFKFCSGLDHFKCYDARAQEHFQPFTIKLTDQFEEQRVTVMRPTTLCNPVVKCVDDQNSATPPDCTPVFNPDDHLVCYETRDDGGKPQFEQREVIVSNQFGKEQRLTVYRRKNQLCVPSLKTHVSGAR